MIAGIIIVALIVLYSAWIIKRKYRQIKNGQYCSCGCGDCQSKCHSKENLKK